MVEVHQDQTVAICESKEPVVLGVAMAALVEVVGAVVSGVAVWPA